VRRRGRWVALPIRMPGSVPVRVRVLAAVVAVRLLPSIPLLLVRLLVLLSRARITLLLLGERRLLLLLRRRVPLLLLLLGRRVALLLLLLLVQHAPTQLGEYRAHGSSGGRRTWKRKVRCGYTAYAWHAHGAPRTSTDDAAARALQISFAAPGLRLPDPRPRTRVAAPSHFLDRQIHTYIMAIHILRSH
jgi:hypothetical protein